MKKALSTLKMIISVYKRNNFKTFIKVILN